MTRYILTCAAALLLLAGCLGGGSPEIPVYRKASYQVRDALLPVNSVSTADHAIASLLYEGLFTVNQYLEVVPALAESWTLDQGGRIYRFKIRGGVKFHDGSVLTAEDVAGTLRGLTNGASPVKPRYERIKRVSVTAPDTVEVELRGPYPPFISLLAAPSARVYKEKPGVPYPVGTGMFRFAALEKKEGAKVLALDRFEDFHGSKPNIRRMEVWELAEKEAFERARKGSIHDTVLFSYANPEKFPADARARSLVRPAAVTWIISFNTGKGRLASKAVRQCLASRFDRDGFVSGFVPSHRVALGLLPPTLMGSGKVRAAAIPRDAGCSEARGAELVLDYPVEVEHSPEMCAYMAGQFAKAGARVRCQGLAFDALLDRIKTGKADLSFLSQTLDLPDVEYYVETFESSFPLNLANYRSPAFDRLLAEARGEPDREKRNAIFARMDQELYENVATLNLSYPPQTSYWHRCLTGMEISIAGESYVDYSRVALSPGCGDRADFAEGAR